MPVTYFFIDDYTMDSRSRLAAVTSYFVRLPAAYQEVILNTTKSTFLDLHGRDVRPGDEIEEFEKSDDEIDDLKENPRKIISTK